VGDILIADYCFLTETFPYALRPDANTAVIMHDLFSSRARQFAALESSDSVVALSEAEECALLGRADAVVAIQKDEAEFLQSRVPGRRIIVAPMAVTPVEAVQPGRGDHVLFVGSSAAPNVDGLRWFLDRCWPRIRAQQPAAILRVAGTVCQKIGAVPTGVELLGLVDDLAPLYADAGLVCSPLRVGSGLKIKLIEALGHGKAVVATSITLQGVREILHDCVRVADDPDGLVSAILDLIVDERARIEIATRGLIAVRHYFSPEACYGAFVDALTGMRPCLRSNDRPW
jgi:glycosyltransferase involved in cell wall biosynthesis